jgi:hypothetical protein
MLDRVRVLGRHEIEQDHVGACICEDGAVMIAGESGADGYDCDAAGRSKRSRTRLLGVAVAKVYRLRVWPPSIT